MVTIIDYEKKYHSEFRRLNLEWLSRYNLLETHDQMVLDDPEGMIIQKGGFIYLAKSGNQVVGSAALAKETDNLYELAKMSVDPAFQGKGISNMLMEKCLEKAREIGARKLMLYSNSQLHKAIRLYEKFGFRYIPVLNAPFVTADIKMELDMHSVH